MPRWAVPSNPGPTATRPSRLLSTRVADDSFGSGTFGSGTFAGGAAPPAASPAAGSVRWATAANPGPPPPKRSRLLTRPTATTPPIALSQIVEIQLVVYDDWNVQRIA